MDLGDTFMTHKRRGDFRETAPQYDAQRWYFGMLCADAPLFMALGNHDGESGSAGTRPEGDAREPLRGQGNVRVRHCVARYLHLSTAGYSQGMKSVFLGGLVGRPPATLEKRILIL